MHVLFCKSKCDYIQLFLFPHSVYGGQPGVLTLCFPWHTQVEQWAPWTIYSTLNFQLKAKVWGNWRQERSNDLPQIIHFTNICWTSLFVGFCTISARPHKEANSKLKSIILNTKLGLSLLLHSALAASSVHIQGTQNLILDLSFKDCRAELRVVCLSPRWGRGSDIAWIVREQTWP